MIFADLERSRFFNRVNKQNTILVRKVMDINSTSASPNLPTEATAAGDRETYPNHTETVDRSPAEAMRSLVVASSLKQGLEAWKAQLERMLVHSRTLTSFERPVGASVHQASNPSNVSRIGTHDESPSMTTRQADFEDAAERIEHRLVELIGEYNEKMQEIATTINHLELATQLVSTCAP